MASDILDAEDGFQIWSTAATILNMNCQLTVGDLRVMWGANNFSSLKKNLLRNVTQYNELELIFRFHKNRGIS
jgi:hypothetical protein